MRRVAAESLLTEPGVQVGGGGLQLTWWQGPTTDDNLDVGLVQVAPGVATPPHVHHKGQVMVTVSGEGFVDDGVERVPVRVGDVVMCPEGSTHVHGCAGDVPWVHLNVTTGTHGVADGFTPSVPS